MDNFYIGAATNGVGGIRADSYGAIRGWGIFTYPDANRKDDKNIYARLGNGKIEGDGEGVERTLDCSEMWQVTNVVFDAVVTSGWYAVNKGMVVMPGVKAFVSDGWQTLGSTNCVGCSKGLEKPDLVNAVRIKASWKSQKVEPYFGAAVLAADRDDAHADALKKNQRPLGFWKAGTFKGRASWTDESRFDFTRAVIDFRYDHTALSGRSDTHIAVLRWDETAQAWKRVARYDTPPADHVASSGELTTVSGDARYSLGLFCVAEETPTGMTIVIK